ncbi:MAG: pyridoxal phosphate-dependent aminotransferase family protein [Ginsengibacter sp.]
MNEDFLDKKLGERIQNNSLRKLLLPTQAIDFCSNDYLGIVKNKLIEKSVSNNLSHGSTGSRLLAGNYSLIGEVENELALFHHADAGLIFNSGYDANTGLLSSVAQKGGLIIYDKLSHASLRDGIRLSFANSISFIHNDINDLEKKLKNAENYHPKFVVTESVFSMDGDFAPLKEIVNLCEKYSASLIVDEAHATGIVGNKGEGLVQLLILENKIFARIHTFGKACGAHGAIVLGSQKLKQYLINFARQFIYSTSLPPSAVEAIRISYKFFPLMEKERNYLQKLISLFQNSSCKYRRLQSETAIQIVIIPGNENVKMVAKKLQENHFDIRPILYPTVPAGQERLRIVLHSFNTEEEVLKMMEILNDC